MTGLIGEQLERPSDLFHLTGLKMAPARVHSANYSVLRETEARL
jgi:hypothetical protein